MNLLDKTIAVFNPEKAHKRAAHRVALKNIRKYEGAARGTNRTKYWNAPSSSANDALLSSLEVLRNRSRQLRRDNSHAHRVIESKTSDVVGTGILTEFSDEELDKKFSDWADSVKIDYDQHLNYHGLQALVMDAVSESGDVLFRRVWRPAKKRKKGEIPFRIQILESDHLDHSKNEITKDGNKIVQGVERDADGDVVAYWLFKEHPNQFSGGFFSKNTSERFDAKDIGIVFDKKRPGQERGVPALAPVMMGIHDHGQANDAELVRIKTAACFTGIVTTNDIDNDEDDDEEDNIIGDRIEPGTFRKLAPGESITFSSPPHSAGINDFLKQNLHSVATGTGMTYSSLSGDLSNVNFSSGRMGQTEARKTTSRFRNNIIVTQFCSRVTEWFIEGYELISTKPIKDRTVTYTPPKREFIDPVKEVNGLLTEVRSGFSSLPEVQRSYGKDPRDVLREIKKVNRQLDDMGIILDSDPRAVSKAGNENSFFKNNGDKNED